MATACGAEAVRAAPEPNVLRKGKSCRDLSVDRRLARRGSRGEAGDRRTGEAKSVHGSAGTGEESGWGSGTPGRYRKDPI